MQKASSHHAHLNFVKWEARNPKLESRNIQIEAFSLPERWFRISEFVLRISHLAKGQMGVAPTHCRHMVSGTISLP